MLAVCVVASASVRAADAPYVSYPLKHVSAADIEPTLNSLLGSDAKQARVVVDLRANQLLVSATPAVHRLVAQLVERLDQPPGQPVQPATVPATLPNARSAPPPTKPKTPLLPKVVPAAATTPQSVAADDRYTQRTVELHRTTAANVEALLRDLLGSRLQPRAGRGAGLNAYELVTPRGSRVEVELDTQQNVVMTRGPERTVREITALVESLDTPQQGADRVVRVVPLGKADRAKLRQAIEAYRGGKTPAATPAPTNLQPPAVRAPANPAPAKPGPRDQGWIDRATGQSIKHLLLQDPAGLPATTNQPTIVVEPGQQPTVVLPIQPGSQAEQVTEQAAEDRLRELGTAVDVEALSDLDVMILRGSERDVNELVRIIQEIERISAESVPQVEVLALQYASSEAVAKIVTQISTELLAGRQGRASVTALVKPNALLLIGWGEALTALKDLVGKLDQPVGPETQFRVFHLKHAAAGATQTTIQNFFLTSARDPRWPARDRR